MRIEIRAQELTGDWFKLVKQIEDDPQATAREKLLAVCLRDCGTVLNRLIVAIPQATVAMN